MIAFLRTLDAGVTFSNFVNLVVNVLYPAFENAERGEDGRVHVGNLKPFDGAAYLPAGGPFYGVVPPSSGVDRILVGQGARADYAYDADLVAHEVAHAAMASQVRYVTVKWDAAGAWSPGFLIEEGLAWYFVAAKGGSKIVSQYLTHRYDGWPPSAASSLDEEDDCRAAFTTLDRPQTVVAGFLWAVRSQIAGNDGERASLVDRAVWYTAVGMPSTADLSTLFETVEQELVVALDAPDPSNIHAIVQSTAAEWGLAPCTRVVELGPQRRLDVSIMPSLGLPPLRPFVPAVVQLEVKVPEARVAKIAFSVGWDSFPEILKEHSQSPDIRAFVKTGSPVNYDYGSGEAKAEAGAAEITGVFDGQRRILELPRSCSASTQFVSLTSWPGTGPTYLRTVELLLEVNRDCVAQTQDGGPGDADVKPAGCSCGNPGEFSGIVLLGWLLSSLCPRRRGSASRYYNR
jgi:hypothetical protein